ncbi:MAG: antitoxin Xre-like helix-turn-helix domain-containing protein, partial [Verrucomicrobiales bacterium]
MKEKIKYQESQPEPLILQDKAHFPEELSSIHVVENYGKMGFENRWNPALMHKLISDGLPVSELNDLQEKIGIPLDQLAQKLGISKATLHRRKAAG